MPQIVTVGETMAAFTPGSTGFLRYVKNYEMRIAGAESNLAIGVSKLGHSAGWISCLGKDEFGEFVQNSIRAEGVDTSRVVFDPEYRTGIMFKQVRNASETSVFYYRENSAASHMRPAAGRGISGPGRCHPPYRDHARAGGQLPGDRAGSHGSGGEA